MPPTRQLAACLALTALLTGGCSGSPDTGSRENGPGRAPAERVRIEVLPPVSQQGGEPAASGESRLVTASVAPASPGSSVILQRHVDQGWRTVSREPQDDAGTAQFTGAALTESPATYRAAVVGPGGERVTSEPEAADWETIFRDEFDGTSLDTASWDYRQLGVYIPGSRDCSTSDSSAVSVSGGTLQLQVLRDPARMDEQCRTAEDGTHHYYVTGHVSTDERFAFTHGVAAARVRFQRPRGQHGAFWLQRKGVPVLAGQPGTSGAEIDVAEFFGEGYPKGGLASFIWYRNASDEDEKLGGMQPRASAALPRGDDWWQSYHVFSVEWTSEGYVFRVDGRETFRTAEGVSDVHQFLVLSLLISNWELPDLRDSALPSTMDVDWVRVWQPAGPGRE